VALKPCRIAAALSSNTWEKLQGILAEHFARRLASSYSGAHPSAFVRGCGRRPGLSLPTADPPDSSHRLTWIAEYRIGPALRQPCRLALQVTSNAWGSLTSPALRNSAGCMTALTRHTRHALRRKFVTTSAPPATETWFPRVRSVARCTPRHPSSAHTADDAPRPVLADGLPA
jgi:hypothetical protein